MQFISSPVAQEALPAGEYLGESPQAPSRFFAKQFSQWSGRDLAAVSAAVLACRHYWATLEHYRDLSEDDRTPRVQLAKLNKRLSKEREKARRQLEPIIEVGLLARKGRCVLPDAVVPPHETPALADWLAWQTLESCVATLAAEVRGLFVCASCTFVFAPKRKHPTRYCRRCSKRRTAASNEVPTTAAWFAEPLRPGRVARQAG